MKDNKVRKRVDGFQKVMHSLMSVYGEHRAGVSVETYPDPQEQIIQNEFATTASYLFESFFPPDYPESAKTQLYWVSVRMILDHTVVSSAK